MWVNIIPMEHEVFGNTYASLTISYILREETCKDIKLIDEDYQS